MSLIDKKKSTTTNTTNNDYTTTTSSTDNRVIEGGIVGGNITGQSIGDVTVSDYGAIEQGVGLAKGSLDFASNVVANAFTLNDENTKNTLLFGKSALDSNLESSKLVSNIAGKSIDKLYENNNNVLNFASSSQGAALNAVKDASNTALSKVSEVVKNANTSDSVQTIKYIMWGVIGVAAVVLLSRSGASLFKTAKGAK